MDLSTQQEKRRALDLSTWQEKSLGFVHMTGEEPWICPHICPHIWEYSSGSGAGSNC